MSRRCHHRVRPVRRTVFGSALAVLFLFLLACGGPPDISQAGQGVGDASGTGEPDARDAIAVKVAPVRQESLSSLYSTSATVRADKQATVIARTRGVVERLAVEEGDRVAAGQPLAYLEDEEQAIEAAITRARKENLDREYERATRLFGEGLLSEEDYETTRGEAEEARHQADRAELALSRTIIRAPFAGRILRRLLDPGATVADGTAIYDLADLEPLYADVNVPERHVARLAPGQAVRLTADSAAGTVEARIDRIAPAVDPETATVKVTVAVAEARALRPGTFVRVDIVTDTHEDALVVPRSALVAEGRRWYMFRLKDDGRRVEMLEVVPGYEEGDRVEILDVLGDPGPLAPGAMVVVVGAAALNDDAPVEVIPSEQESTPASGNARTDTPVGHDGSAGAAV